MILSCKKDKPVTPKTPAPTPVKIGLFEAKSGINKLLFMNISKVGTQSLSYPMVFNTGFAGMILDAESILPKSMITSTGFNFTGDSTVINGITITSKKGEIVYGSGSNTTTVYGSLAYADVTIGDENGNIVIKRLPFFLYFEAVNADETMAAPHSYDVLGVDPQYDYDLTNGPPLQSPFAYYQPATGLKTGFKMAALGTDHFTSGYNYVSDVVTVGLTTADISGTEYVMHQLDDIYPNGYSPVISANVTYNTSKTLKSYIVFDTGAEPYSYISDKSLSGSTVLPVGSKVSFTTRNGFSANYTTTASDYLTVAGNPSTVGSITVFGLDFFLKNSYLMDYTDHSIGLKNN